MIWSAIALLVSCGLILMVDTMMQVRQFRGSGVALGAGFVLQLALKCGVLVLVYFLAVMAMRAGPTP
jgi:hypothetical protein